MELIEGKKYIFRIEYENCYFGIKAQCKSTKRYSYINNLNVILSEFRVSMGDSRVADSTWKIAKYELNKLANITKHILVDMSFLHYLEKQLDLDRELGEWENKQKR